MDLICILKSHLFDGYTQVIDITTVESIEEIIGIVISSLHQLLENYNLKGLIKHLNKLTFRVNKITMDDIMNHRTSKVFIFEDNYSSESSDSSSEDSDEEYVPDSKY